MARAVEGRRKIPSVDALLRSAPGKKGAERFGRPLLKLTLRRVLELAREDAAAGIDPPEPDILMARAVRLAATTWYGVQPVLNATGVILHTGLGRAPLPDRAARAAARA